MSNIKSEIVGAQAANQRDWASALAAAVDEAVRRVVGVGEIISVSVTPIYTTHSSTTERFSTAIWSTPTSSATTSVMVTIAWR